MPNRRVIICFLLFFLFMTGCSEATKTTSLDHVGLLIEDTIDNQGWNRKGYQGLLSIHSKMDINVSYKEGMDSEKKVRAAIEEFSNQNVSLVFGHGQVFADYFMSIANEYPDIHFVSFNGHVNGENVTSLQFDSYAMGYFAGMLASEMSRSESVGVIAAFPWQPEVIGFKDGALRVNEEINVEISYVESWSDKELALQFFDEMLEAGVDLFYPTGDGYHTEIIEKSKQEGLFAIGYVNDQADLGEATVLTSTIQHVDYLYELIAECYQQGELPAGNLVYDFQDGVITLGPFSSQVPEDVQERMDKAVSAYIEEGRLP